MNIGIVGAGQIGGTLAKSLTKLGHTVKIANSRGPATLAEVAKETGARAVTVEDAVRDVEVVVVTIPQKNVPDLPPGLFREVPAEVAVIDTGNYYPTFRDGTIAALEGDETESGWVAGLIGHPVLKVFNNIMAPSLAHGGLPKGAAGRIALPVAGDDARAKATVLALVDALGFDPLDAGSLAESWRQQPGTPIYCTDYSLDDARRALASADRKSSPAGRDATIEKMIKLPPGTTPAEMIQMVRGLHGVPS